jgi:hypothetical protein
MHMRMRAWCVIFVAVACGCDRDPPAPPPPTAQKPASGRVVEIQGVTPLLPDRRTHVAPTGTGQIFWVQESPDAGGRETIFSLADGGLPGATAFSNAAVLDALGERGPGTRGSLQSLAVGPDGDVYFFFAGQGRRKLLVALGAFSPSSGQTRVLADATALRDASGMGNTLALARGSVLRGTGSRTWLWLRHDHGFVLLSLEAGPSGPMLRRVFDRVRPAQDEPLDLVSSRDDLLPLGDGWVYLDRTRGRLWRIGPMGEATTLADVSDLPKALSAPSIDERGRLMMFAPDGPPFVEPPDEPVAALPAPQGLDLPAWVTLDGDRRTVLARPKFRVPSRFNVRALAFPEIVRDRGSWLGYDTQTGELLRLRVVPP